MGPLLRFSPAPTAYANHLAAPGPERTRPLPAGWIPLLLVLACVIPRAVLAARLPSICPDGVLYVRLAEAIEEGDFRAGFQRMALNTYPIILAGLHRLGLDWEFAAALWGVTAASLVVLPLWGWTRRQFDDRVALIAGLLYAVNPKMIEWSPEVMRDPTFWLFFMLAIYWLWRAATEVRLRYYLAGGAAVALAALTRVEGLFLLIPLTLWTMWRLAALEPAHRKNLALYVALCCAVFPALLAVANLGLLSSHSDWVAMRSRPLIRAQMCLASLVGRGNAAAADDPLSFGRTLWIFVPTMTRGLSPIFALLMFGGIWGWRRVWARRDHQPLFYVALAVMAGILVQMRYDRNICPRYALPIVLMAAPWAALGLLGLIDRLARVAERLRWGDAARRAAIAPLAVAAAALSLLDGITGNATYFETRRAAADVGRWMRAEIHGPRTLVGPVGITPIVSFYSDGAPYRTFFWDAEDATILKLVRQSRAAVVLLQPARELTQARCDALAESLKRAGMAPPSREGAPDTRGRFAVLVRGERAPRVARKPPS